jgi:serine protease Do
MDAQRFMGRNTVPRGRTFPTRHQSRFTEDGMLSSGRMAPPPIVRLLLVALVAPILACVDPASATQANLGAATTKKLAAGVFEVVVPRVEDAPGTRYTVPLPLELVPFAQRNEKFVGIATAFAISPTRFVTAAHVLPLLGGTSEHYYLRDASGGTYEVGRIVKYSQYRDLVELELLSPAPNVVPLVVRDSVEVGDVVFTVGNAIGQGIVARGGVVTSRTPEPVNGKWSFLRFTAPASPGNSGGPLVDGSGRVVGVVVQKSAAENLNLAVPIGELAVLGSDKSELMLRRIPFAEDSKEMLADATFSAPLPDSLSALRVAAERSVIDFFKAQYAKFDNRFGKDTFPNAPRLRGYLTHPTIPSGLGTVTVDGNGQWEMPERTTSRRS